MDGINVERNRETTEEDVSTSNEYVKVVSLCMLNCEYNFSKFEECQKSLILRKKVPSPSSKGLFPHGEPP